MGMKLLHGGNIYEESIKKMNQSQRPFVDYSANINPLGMPKGVRRAAAEALLKAEHYPDPLCRKLRAALAEYYGFPKNYFLCGNGGADLIYRFAYALRPKRALLTIPTFAEYEEALTQAGCSLLFYQTQEDLQIRSDILEQMDESLDAVFLCNPNNPTGLLLSQELLHQILEKAERQDILLFVDECFLDFTGQEKERTLMEFTRTSPHLLILKSFTKLYAMPGIRLGFAVSQNQGLLDRMASAGQCWGVSVLAQEAGAAALQEEDYRRRAVELVKEERTYLKRELEALGLNVCDGQADYLFFRAPGITDLYDRLLGQGILIRSCSNYRGLDASCYRIAVKTHETNERLIEALKAVLDRDDV